MRELWLEGNSAAAIAKALDVSRNAVIGKLGRLKIVRRKAVSRSNQAGLLRHGAPKRRLECPAPIVRDAPATAALIALADERCRWPLGDPQAEGFAFCGRPSGKRRSYCAEHHSLAHDPRPLEPIEHFALVERKLYTRREPSRFQGWERRR